MPCRRNRPPVHMSSLRVRPPSPCPPPPASPLSKPILSYRTRPSHPSLHHTYTARTSHSHEMFSTQLTRVAHRATTLATSPSPAAQRTTAQCFATATQQRRPHQRRHSSSKTSCPPDSSSSKPAPAAKTAESSENGNQASGADKTSRRTSRLKRTQVEKSAKGKEEANQFAGLPAVPDTRHVGEKGKKPPERLRITVY